MILCVCTESEAEVEDVLWNIELPIINRTGAGRDQSDLPSAKLTKLGSLPLMDPIAPSVTATIFSSALHLGPLFALNWCFSSLLLLIKSYDSEIQNTGRFYLGYKGNRLSNSHRPTDVKLAPSHWVEKQFRGRDTSPAQTRLGSECKKVSPFFSCSTAQWSWGISNLVRELCGFRN